MQLKNKTIVVTGGGNGIGRELVLGLLARGALVAAVDINEKTLLETSQLAGDHSDRLSVHVVNIADKEAIGKLPEEVISRHGQVDGIINNAGIIQPFIRLKDLDYSVIERVMNVNFYGTIYMIKAFLPHLLNRPEGYIANISSMGGFLPVPGQTLYGASKAAVKLMTEGLWAELLETHVKVSVIFPGAIETNITANSGVTINRPSDTDAKKSGMKTLPASRAASIMLDGIERNKPRIFVGSDSRMINKLYSLSPLYATRMVTRQMKGLLSK